MSFAYFMFETIAGVIIIGVIALFVIKISEFITNKPNKN